MADYATVGTNARVVRRAREDKQSQIARDAGLSQAYYSNVERGMRPRSLDEVRRIAKALGVSVEALTGPPIDVAQTLELLAGSRRR